MVQGDTMGREVRSATKTGSVGLVIAGIVVGAIALLGCCGVVGVGAFLLFFRAATTSDIVGRWENDDLSKLILDFRPDGTDVIDVPAAKVRIPITFKLVNDELTITPAQPLGLGEQHFFDGIGRTRVQRIGNELRMEGLAGPAQGQAMFLKKIG